MVEHNGRENVNEQAEWKRNLIQGIQMVTECLDPRNEASLLAKFASKIPPSGTFERFPSNPSNSIPEGPFLRYLPGGSVTNCPK